MGGGTFSQSCKARPLKHSPPQVGAGSQGWGAAGRAVGSLGLCAPPDVGSVAAPQRLSPLTHPTALPWDTAARQPLPADSNGDVPLSPGPQCHLCSCSEPLLSGCSILPRALVLHRGGPWLQAGRVGDTGSPDARPQSIPSGIPCPRGTHRRHSASLSPVSHRVPAPLLAPQRGGGEEKGAAFPSAPLPWGWLPAFRHGESGRICVAAGTSFLPRLLPDDSCPGSGGGLIAGRGGEGKGRETASAEGGKEGKERRRAARPGHCAHIVPGASRARCGAAAAALTALPAPDELHGGEGHRGWGRG